MSPGMEGALVGAVLGIGLWSLFDVLVADRHTSVEDRVLPYLRDLPGNGTRRPPTPRLVGRRSAAAAFLGPALRAIAGVLDRVLGGNASIQSRIRRAHLPITVHDFRIEQAVWGLVAFGVVAVPAGLVALRAPERSVALLLCCCFAMVLGILLRENRLTAQVETHERAVLQEFPAIAELLALAVAAGESPVAALDRVVRRATGALPLELRDLLAEIHLGTPVVVAFDRFAARSGVAAVSRFASAVSVAVERGTPLAEVLHAQAGDVREAGRRALIESGARREVLMMVPVVFLVLPTVVIFAFWPGLVGLDLVVP